VACIIAFGLKKIATNKKIINILLKVLLGSVSVIKEMLELYIKM
jgi:hypothetical protein